jgi:hypothetical protein
VTLLPSLRSKRHRVSLRKADFLGTIRSFSPLRARSDLLTRRQCLLLGLCMCRRDKKWVQSCAESYGHRLSRAAFRSTMEPAFPHVRGRACTAGRRLDVNLIVQAGNGDLDDCLILHAQQPEPASLRVARVRSLRSPSRPVRQSADRNYRESGRPN